MRIDAHQHFWCFTEKDYGWIGKNETVLKQHFLPEQLAQILSDNDLEGCVAVQARQSLEETLWLLALASEHSIIKGVVGWIDLTAKDLNHQLDALSSYHRLKAFRHVIQDEVDPNFMLEPAFLRGLNRIAEYGYRYDLLIFSHQLPQAIELVKQVPSLNIVVDHIAKPQIASGDNMEEWKSNIELISQYKNVYCKVSGMVTEADVNHWQQSDFTPYLDTIFSAFGRERIMYGSDWPVCLLGGSYSRIKQIIEVYVNAHCPEAFEQVFGQNAVSFYQLEQ